MTLSWILFKQTFLFFLWLYRSLKLCFCLFGLFFPCCSGNFYCTFFQFTYFCLHSLHSAFELITGILKFRLLRFFSSKIFISFFSVPSFMRLYFSFVSSMFIIAHWSTFMMNALMLKPLSDNSNTPVISVMVSVDCLFSFEFFRVLDVKSDFQLKLGHVWYYVMRCWVWFKASVLAGLFWHHSGREEGGARPWYC